MKIEQRVKRNSSAFYKKMESVVWEPPTPTPQGKCRRCDKQLTDYKLGTSGPPKVWCSTKCKQDHRQAEKEAAKPKCKCGNSLPLHKNIWCSDECCLRHHLKNIRDENAKRLTDRACQFCGETFQPKQWNSLTCYKDECQHSHRNREARRFNEKRVGGLLRDKVKQCAQCKKEFVGAHLIYCSNKCLERNGKNKWSKKNVEALSDTYIKSILRSESRRSGIAVDSDLEVPQFIIEMKRMEMETCRLIKAGRA